jgi:hypothetical protein
MTKARGRPGARLSIPSWSGAGPIRQESTSVTGIGTREGIPPDETDRAFDEALDRAHQELCLRIAAAPDSMTLAEQSAAELRCYRIALDASDAGR